MTCTPSQGATLFRVVLLLMSLLWTSSPSETWGESTDQNALNRGATLYREGRFKEALLAFEAATRSDPGALIGWEKLGWTHRRLHDDDAAIKTWEIVLKIEPGHVRLLNEIGAIHLERGLPEKAKEVFLESLKQRPEQPDILFRLAQMAEMARGQKKSFEHYAAAEKAYRAILKDTPDSHRDLTRLGWALYRQGKISDAMAAWERSLEIDGNQPRLFRHLADGHLALGSLSKAGVWYEKTLLHDAKNPKIFYHLAEIALRQNRGEEVTAWLDRLFDLSEDTAWPVRVAHLFMRHDQAESGLAFFKKKSDDTLQNMGVNRALGKLYSARASAAYREGRWADAALAWETSIDLDEDQPRIFRPLADTYLALEDGSKAKAWYERALQHDPENPKVLYPLAEIALRQADEVEADLWLSRLTTLPNLAEQWFLKTADLFLRHGQTEQGLLFFEKRLADFPEKREIKLALGRIHRDRARIAYRERRWDDAVTGYKKAIEFDPASTRVLRDLGWAYWQSGQWDLCEQTWRRYRAADPDHAEPHNLLARLHLFRKEYAAAIDSINTSLRIDPDQPHEKLKLAKALFWNKQYAPSKTLIETLASQYPENLPIQRFWGEVLMAYHDFSRGATQWRKILDVDAHTPRGTYYWLFSLYSLGKYEEAIEGARQIIAREGPDKDLLKFLAEDALVQGNKKGAIPFYEALTHHFPEIPAFFLTLSLLYHETDGEALAYESLMRAVRLHPDNLEILLGLADNQWAMKQYEAAYTAYSAILERHPSNYRAYKGALHTLMALKRFDGALALLESNRLTFLKDYELDLLKGQIAAGMQKINEAQEIFMRAAPGEQPGQETTLSLPILMYHGIGEHRRSMSLFRERLSSQLKALKDHGYTTLMLSQLDVFFSGLQPWPEKPILMTFDDARIDSFLEGDPILAQYGMVATMFVPTGRIHPAGPFFSDWEMLRHYQKTGRWDLQGHGHYSHDPVPIDATGKQGKFLVNRQWRAQDGRLETQTEFIDRLRQDYREGIDQIEKQGDGGEVVGYAFPFSESGQESAGGEADASEINEKLVFESYRYAFIQDQSGYNRVSSLETRPLMLRRFAVPSSWDGAKLIQHLVDHDPSHETRIELGNALYDQGDYQQSRRVFEQLAMGGDVVPTVTERHLAAISYRQERYRKAQEHLERAWNPQIPPSPASLKLMERTLWKNRPSIHHRTHFSEDRNDRNHWGNLLSFRYPFRRPVDLLVDAGTVRFSEEGQDDLSGQEISVGGQWKPLNPGRIEVKLRHRAMNRTKNTLNGWLTGDYVVDRHALKLQWAYEDVDTLSAHALNLQSRRYAASYSVRFTPRWKGQTGFSFRDYEDGNERTEGWIRIDHPLNRWPDWQIGGSLTHNDTKFASRLYYTPRDLDIGRGILSYHYPVNTVWALDAEVGAGLARDSSGTSWVHHEKLNLTQVWSARAETDFGVDLSNAPRYRSRSFHGSLHWRF